MKTIVRSLSGCSKKERIRRLVHMLEQNGVQTVMQQDKDAVNILAGDFNDKTKLPMLCAHYDIVPESSGANDNLASVAILVRLLTTCRCRAVFLDGEESGHTGAKLFCARASRSRIECIVVLDVCGYGNCIAYWIRHGRFCRFFRKLTAGGMKKKYHLLSLPFLPESDDQVLVSLGRPLMRMSVLPECDAQALRSLETYPECMASLQELAASLEVCKTIHGGPLDDPDIVMPESMENVYRSLQEAFN